MRPDQSLTELINEAARTGVPAKFTYNSVTYEFSPEDLLAFIQAEGGFTSDGATGDFTDVTADTLTVGTTLVVDGDVGEVTIDVASEAFTITGLPTADPAIAGRLWNDAGTLKISAGA